MKKYSANSYLIRAIFILLLAFSYSPPTWSFFITRLIPFPTLEQAKVYEGTLQFKAKRIEHLNMAGLCLNIL